LDCSICQLRDYPITQLPDSLSSLFPAGILVPTLFLFGTCGSDGRRKYGAKFRRFFVKASNFLRFNQSGGVDELEPALALVGFLGNDPNP
jgi:hypothetical protein